MVFLIKIRRIEGNVVHVRLTTHDNGNKVSDKDYQLAVNLSEASILRSEHFNYSGLQNLIGLSAFIGLLILFDAIYNRKRRYQIGPNDFILADINGSRDKVTHKYTYDPKL